MYNVSAPRISTTSLVSTLTSSRIFCVSYAVRPKKIMIARAEITICITVLPIKILTMLAIMIAINPININLPILSKLRLVKYPYALITPNKIAALMNAPKMDPIVYTLKIIAKLRPISAANPCNNARQVPRGGFCASTYITPNTAAIGAKITTHFNIPVKKNFITNINITIRSLTGELIKFSDDFIYTIVKLHFRKKLV